MPITLERTRIDDVWIIQSPIFRDERGYFTELYQQKTWRDLGLAVDFVQDNLSCSAEGTLRGMHYQLEPHGVGKLVRAVSGSIYDVAVDLRKGSPTFSQWIGKELTAENGLAMWVPAGFAHGFLALTPNTLVQYKCTAFWNRDSERTLVWNDPEVNIEWPREPKLINPRDAAAPTLETAEYNFVYAGGS